MKKRVIVIGLVVLSFLLIFGLVSLSLTGFSVSQEPIDEQYLESLREQVNVECLQNSQCLEGFECVSNSCVEKNKVDLLICDNIGLSTPTRHLTKGSPIGSIKEVLTDAQLPYLLSDGLIVENINEKLNEYYYTQVILIGENKIEEDGSNYLIRAINDPVSPVYTLKVTFSKSIDFSNENIRGQTLRILGEEYVINSNSGNSNIRLASNNPTIRLIHGEKVGKGFFSIGIDGSSTRINKDSNGNILGFNIEFTMEDVKTDSVLLGESYVEPVFNAVDLSFEGVDTYGFADVKIGGNCI